jgi:hypothetical protein
MVAGLVETPPSKAAMSLEVGTMPPVQFAVLLHLLLAPAPDQVMTAP